MDSTLLNLIHDDDVFDDNYSNYISDFWSNDSEMMTMQLAETLQGILPIPPTKELHEDVNKNSMMFNNFAEENETDIDINGLISVNSNPNILNINNYCNNNDIIIDEETDDVFFKNNHSTNNDFTFHMNTDSSSIGDYESHTSDYEDDNDNVNINYNYVHHNNDYDNNNDSDVEFKYKNDDNIEQYSNDMCTIDDGSDDFDLAEFITEDYNETNSELMNIRKIIPINDIQNLTCMNSKQKFIHSNEKNNTDSDDDESDIIIDVESLETDETKAADSLRLHSFNIFESEEDDDEDDNTYIDNVGDDPSWSPQKNTVKKMIPKQHNTNNNLTFKNKTQNILKNKRSNCEKSNKSTSKICRKTRDILNEKIGKKPKPKTINDGKKIEEKSIQDENRVAKIPILSKPITINEEIKINSSNTVPIKSISTITQKTNATLPSVKRKLNLEEYKKRHGCTIDTKNNSNHVNHNKQNDNTETIKENITQNKHSEMVTSIVKQLKELQEIKCIQRPVVDPITEARNKVLRLQKLKRAKQLRIIDNTVSSKVPKISELPPLHEMTKHTNTNTYTTQDSMLQCKKTQLEQRSVKRNINTDYEEITIVSISCNTDISMPPHVSTNVVTVNEALAKPMLKPASAKLLSTIRDTVQKVNNAESVKISTNSLIASIQNVVMKKSLNDTKEQNKCTMLNRCSNVDKSENIEQHGEDKIIMYLPKNRVRKRTCTVASQTDLNPAFSFLSIIRPHTSRSRSRSRSRSYERLHHTKCKRKKNYKYSSSDSQQSDDSIRSSYYSCGSTLSIDHMPAYDSAIGTGGYTSRSSRRCRSSSNQSSCSPTMKRVRRGRRQRRISYNKQYRHTSFRSISRSSTDSSISNYQTSYSLSSKRSRSRSNSKVIPDYKSNKKVLEQNRMKNMRLYDPHASEAVEERRVVYVGRIEDSTTKGMLKKKFSTYGSIRNVSVHYKESRMKYGFITFERAQDAFAAIDNSSHDPQINMYDVSFGGRRAFCRAAYEDLDSAGINKYESYVYPNIANKTRQEDTFETLLQKMKATLSGIQNQGLSLPSKALTNDNIITNNRNQSGRSTVNEI